MMSETTDKPAEHPDEDRVSLESNGKSPTNVMGTLEKFGSSIRSNMKRAANFSPLSPEGKGSKVTPNKAGSKPPPSSSPSSGSIQTSPLRNIGGFFQKKDENEADVTPHKSTVLTRSQTDPNMSKSSIIERMASGRQSLGFGTKKEKNKNYKQDPLFSVTEVSGTENNEDKEEEVDEVEKMEEIEEAYTLPEIPHLPLSVMQISKLIEMEVLEEAHLNLLALRQELQKEQESCGEDLPTEIVKREKDLSLLYGDLRNKINTIVRDSNSLPSRNKDLLVPVARIIQEEEKRAKEPGGLPGSWMESWREAVAQGVQAKVDSIYLQRKEQSNSWLAVHLGLLGKAIVEDLEKVKRELRWSYPPSFKVFSTYVSSYHRVIGQHLKKLEQQATEMRGLYALLHWIINCYKSESIMGSLSLQPDMKDESSDLELENGFLNQLKDKYCCKMKEDMRFSLNRITELEVTEFWAEKKSPEKEEDFLCSQFHMDIWMQVKGNAMKSQAIDVQLEPKVISSCLEELQLFPKMFDTEFRRHCSALKPQPLWIEYQICYINSFTALQQHMESYQEACPDQVEGFKNEVVWLNARLMQELKDQYKEDVMPYLRRMLTRKWLTNDEDFKQLHSRTERLRHDCSTMMSPHAQEFASRLHYHVVREYVGQLMKCNYSCKSRKHEKAASKIREQLHGLQDLFEDMNSTHEWLYAVGDDLSDIIGQKNKTDIKNHLQSIVEHYPDFRTKTS